MIHANACGRPVEITFRAPSKAHASLTHPDLAHIQPPRRRGGEATQRIANPCTPVRIRSSPPAFSEPHPEPAPLGTVLASSERVVRQLGITCFGEN